MENEAKSRRGLAGLWRDLRGGDLWVRLSLLLCGAGYAARGQYMKGLLVTLAQALVLWFVPSVLWPYMSKLGTLGTVQAEKLYNAVTRRNEWNQYDNSFQILLFGVIGCALVLAALYLWLHNIRAVRALQLRAESGGRVNTFAQDVAEWFDRRFHRTLLLLPSLGVLCFTIFPLLVMILI
ncbi:MAG: hypothetical protein PHY12_12705, partial [Eubacteriales bacterium]|nr:hypothetical protein [Eubacteriales bacterium]